MSFFSSLIKVGNPESQNIMDKLRTQNEDRIRQIKKYRDYYNGRQVASLDDDGSDLPYADISFSVVEKSVSWLTDKKPEMKGRDDIQDVLEELYREIEENSGAVFFSDVVREGSITGDAFIQVSFDAGANYGVGGYRFRLLQSERCFPEYRNVGNNLKLARFLHSWDQINDAGEVETIYELWSDTDVIVTPDRVPLSLIGWPGLDSIPYTLESYSNKDYRRYKNPYGELPFVHIKNLSLTDSVFGRSDLHTLWILNKEINEQLLSYKDNVDYHGNPITLLFGISANQVERGGNKVWGNLPTDGEVKNLEMTDTHESILKYLGLLREFIGLGSIPYYLIGNTSNPDAIGDTSGVAMKLVYLPISEVISRKQKTYGEGFVKLFEMSLRFMNDIYGLELSNLDGPDLQSFQNIVDNDKLTDMQKDLLIKLRNLPFWKTEIIWQDHLPKSRQAELTDISIELQNNLESLPGALRRLGVKDIEGKLEEIVESIRLMQELEGADEEEFVDDDLGGAGRKVEPESVTTIEDETGQSAERTLDQRNAGTGQSD